jgi:hypothetical protein
MVRNGLFWAWLLPQLLSASVALKARFLDAHENRAQVAGVVSDVFSAPGLLYVASLSEGKDTGQEMA